MPCASARLLHKTEVSRLLWTTNHLHGLRNIEGVVLEKSGHLVLGL